MDYKRGFAALENALATIDEASKRDINLYKAQFFENLREQERYGDSEQLRSQSLSSSVCKWYSVDLFGREAPREADRELIANTRPILRRHRPFPCDLTRDQEQQLTRRLRAWK